MNYNFTNWSHPHTAPLDLRGPINEVIEAWRPFIKPGDHCIDVGAWLGDTAIAMAVLAGSDGRVDAFEPNPAAFDVLARNCVQPDELAIIHPHCFGISDYSGRATFHYSDAGHLNGGLLLPGRVHTIKHTFPLDVAVERLHKFLRVDTKFIKLDTEGNDLRILKDITLQIQLSRPIIQVELYPDMNADERLDLAMFLVDAGYKLSFLNSAEPVTADSVVSTRHADIIAHA